MATSCCGFAQAIILLGKGDGTFPQQQILPMGNSGVSVLLADLTDDKKNGMLIATEGNPNQFEVFLQQVGIRAHADTDGEP